MFLKIEMIDFALINEFGLVSTFYNKLKTFITLKSANSKT